MHQHKWKFRRQLAAECAEEKLNLYGIRYDNAESISLIRLSQATERKWKNCWLHKYCWYTILKGKHLLRWYLQGCRGQTLILTLDLTVQGDATSLLVRGQQRREVHYLLQTGAGLNWATLASLQRCHCVAVATILEQHHIHTLLDHGLNFLDHFVRVVADADVDAYSLPVQVQLLV